MVLRATPTSSRAGQRTKLPFIAALVLATTAACGGTSDEESPTITADEGQGQGAGTPESIQEKGTLEVCNSTTSYAPMYWDEGGEPVGIDIELADALADEWDVSLALKRMAFEGLFPAMEAQRCDLLLSGLLITDSRLAGSDGVPYLATGPAIVTSATFDGEVATPDDLSGVTLAVQQGTGQEDEMLELNAQLEADGLDPITLQTYPDTSSAVQAVMAGHADAFVETKMVAAYIADQRDELELQDGVFPDTAAYGIFLPKDSPLTGAVTQAVSNIVQEGTLASIAETYSVDGSQVVDPAEGLEDDASNS